MPCRTIRAPQRLAERSCAFAIWHHDETQRLTTAQARTTSPP
nr:MAG TPA: hypothetical protein [Caudoviricetes sp.]